MKTGKDNIRAGIDLDVKTLINTRFLAKNLEFPPSKKVSQEINGRYLSTTRGRGIDFDEVRKYQAGDDIRNMDWRVTARTDIPHTKVYKEEKDKPVIIAVDLGSSMQFGTKRALKSVAAAEIAALLGWSANLAGERVGGLAFSEKSHFESKPTHGDKGVLKLINCICKQTEKKIENLHPNYFGSALFRLSKVCRSGTSLIIVSDFRSVTKDGWHLIKILSAKCDLFLINLYDPIEKEPPPPGIYGITDGKSRIELNTNDKGTITKYRDFFNSHNKSLLEFCKKNSIFLTDISTGDSGNNLLSKLTNRSISTKKRRRF